MRARRGITLLGVLWLMALLASLSMMATGVVRTVQGQLSNHKQKQQAAAMAISGRDYAAAMIRSGRWKGTQHFRSPVFNGAESFEVEVAGKRIVSIGWCGETRVRLEGAP